MITRVVCYGLGPIGLRIAQVAMARPAIRIAGAIDTDPAKAGQDLGRLLGGAPNGVIVSGDAATVLSIVKPQVVLHATGSSLTHVVPQLREIIAAGAHAVSTCEELAYPWTTQPQLAAELDAAARRAGVAVLGTGVNPGYAMDALPLMLTAPCATVRAIRVLRVVDAAQRRGPLQRKIGAGLTPYEFAERVRAGTVGHVGLAESLHMLATALGWSLERTEETIEAIPASSPLTTDELTVGVGQVAGVRQVAAGLMGDREVLRLELQMYLGARDPQDSVEIDGDPPVQMRIAGGLHGDTATAAIVVNAIPTVLSAAPGLASMADVPLVHCW